MDSIDALKKHLKSTKNLKKIVSTMKTLSATNIKRYEKVSLNLNKYLNNIYLAFHGMIINNKQILDYLEYSEKKVETDTSKQTIAIVIGSNQGLCGRFNSKIIDFFLTDVNEVYYSGYKLITIGDKIELLMKGKKIPIYQSISLPNTIENIVHIVYSVFVIIEEVLKKNPLSVYVYFTEYDSKSNGILTKHKIIPLENSFFKKLSSKKWPTNKIATWRMDLKELYSDLLKQYIFINLYSAIASSMASEQKNRFITLQGADDNIAKNISETTLKYNQTRQTVITSELIDTVIGYKTLKKKS